MPHPSPRPTDRIPPTHPVDVFLILTRDDRVLLALREGTGYADGEWNLPSGKLEFGEDAVCAVIREAAEEIGIRLTPDEVRPATTVHYRNRLGQGRIGLIFVADHVPDRHSEPVNAEPHKCAGIGWFPVDGLPDATDAYTTVSIGAWRSGVRLQVSGWTGARIVRSGR